MTMRMTMIAIVKVHGGRIIIMITIVFINPIFLVIIIISINGSEIISCKFEFNIFIFAWDILVLK